MAIVALQVDTMIARIGSRLVIEYERCPEIPAMAIVTLKLRIEVSAAFAGRSGAIVATATCTRRNGAVIKARGQPCVRGMTDIALRGSLQVADMFANRDRSVVTAAAAA